MQIYTFQSDLFKNAFQFYTKICTDRVGCTSKEMIGFLDNLQDVKRKENDFFNKNIPFSN